MEIWMNLMDNTPRPPLAKRGSRSKESPPLLRGGFRGCLKKLVTKSIL